MVVRIYPTAESLTERAAEEIASVLRSGETGTRRDLGLAGGSTPRPVYERLRQLDVPWELVDLWLSDERWVPHDHSSSNGRMVAEALASHVPARFHRPRWSSTLDAHDTAAFYEATLRSVIGSAGIHLVLLGMGTDGHTASLFPGSSALNSPEWRWYVATHTEADEPWRLTVTPGFLHQAEQIMVLVSGEGKAETLAGVLEGPDGRYPIQLLASAQGRVTWLVDEAAARKLVSTEAESIS